jgi:hypothetical protein
LWAMTCFLPTQELEVQEEEEEELVQNYLM